MDNEIEPTQIIEGEFVVEELSGFSCRKCGRRLFVGSTACPKCCRSFELPTPNLNNVPEGYSPARAKVMAAVYRDRVTDQEIEKRYASRGLQRPTED